MQSSALNYLKSTLTSAEQSPMGESEVLTLQVYRQEYHQYIKDEEMKHLLGQKDEQIRTM